MPGVDDQSWWSFGFLSEHSSQLFFPGVACERSPSLASCIINALEKGLRDCPWQE